MHPDRPFGRLLGEALQDLPEGQIHVLADDQRPRFARGVREVGADEDDPRLRRVELFFVVLVADEAQLFRGRVRDRRHGADGPFGIAFDLAAGDLGDLARGHGQLFHGEKFLSVWYGLCKRKNRHLRGGVTGGGAGRGLTAVRLRSSITTRVRSQASGKTSSAGCSFIVLPEESKT